MPHYYSLNKRYRVSNFSANTFASLPLLKKTVLVGALALPLIGGTAGYIYGGIRHKNKINQLNDRLAKTINPYEREQIQEEINRVNSGGFLKRAGLVGGGFGAGIAVQKAISKPVVKWILANK